MFFWILAYFISTLSITSSFSPNICYRWRRPIFSLKMTSKESDSSTREIIIVGAGMAGIACAHEILAKYKDNDDQTIKVTMFEASDDIGGRVKGDCEFVPGHIIDLGAEFVHGRGHVLWEYINTFIGKTHREDDTISIECNDDKFESIFLLSHADGGPQEEPTSEGKFGMYYVDGELIMYNDPRLESLNKSLEALSTKTYNKEDSMKDALYNVNNTISESLMELAVSSYGNTAGCCDLSKLSMQQLLDFEHYWEANEDEGDYRPPSTLGMYGIAKAAIQHLEEYKNFELIKCCEVEMIQQDDHGVLVKTNNSEKQQQIYTSDVIVLTVPPPILPKIIIDFPASKTEALAKIGFERAIKVICKFRYPIWPTNVQSVISTGEPIPEIWFRAIPEEAISTGADCLYLATGFLVSTAADKFLDSISMGIGRKTKQEMAGLILFKQVTKMFKHSNSKIPAFSDDVLLDTILFDWKEDAPFAQGGYMYPKVGITKEHLKRLAEPFGRCYFAGEATNTNACCTVQAAMETGQRAAKEVDSFFKE